MVDKKPQVGRGPFDQLLIWQEDTVALGLFDAQQRHLDRVPPMSLTTATATSAPISFVTAVTTFTVTWNENVQLPSNCKTSSEQKI